MEQHHRLPTPVMSHQDRVAAMLTSTSGWAYHGYDDEYNWLKNYVMIEHRTGRTEYTTWENHPDRSEDDMPYCYRTSRYTFCLTMMSNTPSEYLTVGLECLPSATMPETIVRQRQEGGHSLSNMMGTIAWHTTTRDQVPFRFDRRWKCIIGPASPSSSHIDEKIQYTGPMRWHLAVYAHGRVVGIFSAPDMCVRSKKPQSRIPKAMRSNMEVDAKSDASSNSTVYYDALSEEHHTVNDIIVPDASTCLPFASAVVQGECSTLPIVMPDTSLIAEVSFWESELFQSLNNTSTSSLSSCSTASPTCSIDEPFAPFVSCDVWSNNDDFTSQRMFGSPIFSDSFF